MSFIWMSKGVGAELANFNWTMQDSWWIYLGPIRLDNSRTSTTWCAFSLPYMMCLLVIDSCCTRSLPSFNAYLSPWGNLWLPACLTIMLSESRRRTMWRQWQLMQKSKNPPHLLKEHAPITLEVSAWVSESADHRCTALHCTVTAYFLLLLLVSLALLDSNNRFIREVSSLL